MRCIISLYYKVGESGSFFCFSNAASEEENGGFRFLKSRRSGRSDFPACTTAFSFAVAGQALGVCIYSVLAPIGVVVLLAQFFFYLCQFCFQILHFAFICFPVDLLLQLLFLLF